MIQVNFTCPVCNNEMQHITEKKLLFFTRKIRCGNYFYYHCHYCGHILLDLPEEVNLKYQSNYRVHMQTSGDIVNNELSDKYYSYREGILTGRTAKVDRFIKGKTSIFDIGCGGGYMLKYYKERGCKVSGIEIDDLCIKACQKLGIDCIQGDFIKTEITQRFDVVMAWHTLEHILDINDFLQRVINITNRNGLFIIEIPINRGLIKEWQDYDGHVHFFTKGSLKRLIGKHNVECQHEEEGIQKPAWLIIGKVS